MSCGNNFISHVVSKRYIVVTKCIVMVRFLFHSSIHFPLCGCTFLFYCFWCAKEAAMHSSKVYHYFLKDKAIIKWADVKRVTSWLQFGGGWFHIR